MPPASSAPRPSFHLGRVQVLDGKDPAALPLALGEAASDAALTSEQSQELESLQDRFIEEVGENQNPEDPAYRKRWFEARRRSDEEFKRLYGRQAFLARQLQELGTKQP
jgi:hypothetical protein